MSTIFPNERVEEPRPLLWRLVQASVVLICLDTAALLLNMQSWKIGGGTILWPANGLLVGMLLYVRRRDWPAYLVVGFTVDLGVNFLLTHVSWASVYVTFCNSLEVILAALLLYRTISPRPDLTQRSQLKALLLYGVVLAPAVTSAVIQLNPKVRHMSPFFALFSNWFTADALGMAVMTPLYLSFAKGERIKRSLFEIAGLFGLLIGIAVFVFWQTRFPFLFLVLPVLLLLGVRLRLAGSALGLLIVAIIGGYLTIVGRGPVALVHPGSITVHERVLQFFIAVSMLVLYVIEVGFSERERLQDNLQASETRFRLLAEASRDVIILSDLSDRRRYVSPAVTSVLGWEPHELLGQTYRQVVHPDDINGVTEMLAACREGKPVDAFAYRCRKKDGSYLWIEASIRLCTDEATGDPVGFVKVERDISTRKAAEEELNRAFRMVENMAMVDGLTGVANRRRFEEAIDQEWRRAMRDGSILSLLMIDVDHFKPYNDLYGHVMGDNCLRQVATAVQQALHRTSDLFARYGGEEFSVVLPNTDSRGAEQLAEQMREAVQQLNLPHAGNPHGVVTISIGCAAGTFSHDSSVTALLESADQALYQAKSAGRNRIEVAQWHHAANGMI